MEEDIWSIAAKVLSGEQRDELRHLILCWRKNNPDTIAEVTTLVETTNQLVGTVGLENLLPEIVKTIDEMGNEDQELIDHSFRQAVLLILIAMGAYIIARLIYN